MPHNADHGVDPTKAVISGRNRPDSMIVWRGRQVTRPLAVSGLRRTHAPLVPVVKEGSRARLTYHAQAIRLHSDSADHGCRTHRAPARAHLYPRSSPPDASEAG